MSPRDLTVGDLASQLTSRGLVATSGRVTLAGIVARVQHARSLAVGLDPWRERARSLRLAGHYRAMRDSHEPGAIERRVYDEHRLDADIEAHVLGVLGAARDADLVRCPACRGSGEGTPVRAYHCPETGWHDDGTTPCARCEGHGELPRYVLEREERERAEVVADLASASEIGDDAWPWEVGS